MKKKFSHLKGLKTAAMPVACVLATTFTARAQVSTQDFNSLKATVLELSQQVKSLNESNAAASRMHELDQAELKDLRTQLKSTQQQAEDAEQKSTAASQAQAAPAEMPRVPLDEATVNHNFQILGDAEFQYVNTDHQNGGFQLADFAPIFLYRGGDNILFEAGFDTTLGNNAPGSSGYTTSFDLSFAQLDYVVNDYLTVCAGDILLPLGTYVERGAGWLNKIPDDPLAIDLIPGNGIGAELRGAYAVGENGKILNYAVYGVNGPGSTDGTGNASALDLGGNVGVRSDGTSANLHRNMSGGGRLGFFMPFYKPRYDIELGLSGQFGEWDNDGNHLWSSGVLDAALHLGPNFEAKGEYIISAYGSDDLGMVRPHGWFVQAGYKLAGLNRTWPLINDMELVGRYDSVVDGLGTKTKRYTVGGIYYLTTALLLEGDYEFINSNDPTQPSGQLILQASYGF